MNKSTIIKRNASRFLLLAMFLIGAHAAASAQSNIPKRDRPEIRVTRLVAAAAGTGDCSKLAFTIKNIGKRDSSPFAIEIQSISYKPAEPGKEPEVDEAKTKVLKTLLIDGLAGNTSRYFAESKDLLENLQLPDGGIYRFFIKSESDESSKKERSVIIMKLCIKQ